jgi:hypothetical protein
MTVVNGQGYRYVTVPNDPRVAHLPRKLRRIAEHVLIVEAVLGHTLPKNAVVHHVNGLSNEHDNLVVLENQAEHMRLHARLRVLRAGGNPWTERICGRCHRPMPNRPERYRCAPCQAAYDAGRCPRVRKTPPATVPR